MKYKQAWLNWRKLIVDDRDLSFGGKAIGLYLNTYMNDSHDMAYPSISRICGEMNISNKTATKHTDDLEKAGYIRKQKRFGNSTIYHATIPSNVESTLMENLQCSNVESTPPVVENLHTNKQVNKQSNKQIVPKKINSAAWSEFEQHRKEMRKPLSELARTKAMNVIIDLPFDEQAKVIDKTIQNRWTGLFLEKTNEKHNGTGKPESHHATVVKMLRTRIADGDTSA